MAGRQSLLAGIGLIGAVPAAILPWILATQVAPMYRAAEAPLPGLTAWWMDFWPVSLLLPLAVALLWWRLDGHPRRGEFTATVSALGAMVVDGLSVIALWLPLLRLPDLAA